jgi:aminoglycoside phosphotransferase (APT) family kinase protein/MFS family permease
MRERLRILRPLRERDFRLLWMGQAASLVGDGIFTVALAWQTYDLSGSPAALSSVLLARALPLIGLLLVGGAIADRVPRRRLLLLSDAIRGLAVSTMALLSAAGIIEVWHLIVLAALFGAGDAFFAPAYTAILPDLVTPGVLTQANSLDSFTHTFTRWLVGPALGGVVVASAGAPWGFTVDAATFVLSVAFLAAMRPRPAPAVSERAGMVTEIREGFRYTRSVPWIWVTLLVAAGAVLALEGPFEVLLPLIVREELGGGAARFGLILSIGGVGDLLGAALIGQRGLGRRPIPVMYLAWAAATLLFGALALAPSAAVAAAFAFLAGIGFQVGTITWDTLLQSHVPKRVLGRVSSLDWLISYGLAPLSFAGAGLVATAVGAVATLAGGGALACLFWLTGLIILRRRRVDVPEEVLSEQNRLGQEPAGDRRDLMFAGKMHAKEADIDVSLVGRLLSAQFPQWASLSIEPVHSAGTDHALYRLGDDMVVRLPRIREATGQVEKEHRWLPRLAPQLPLDIPIPLAKGTPAEGYPWPWSVYRWLDGETATDDRIADPRQAATDLARFLAALQQIDPTGGPPPGEHNSFRGEPLAARDAETRAAIAALARSLNAEAATTAWEAALQAPGWQGPAVWLHGDLHAANLLARGGRLSAVTDFGCLVVGDPACDLMVAWTYLSAETRGVFRAALSADGATWTRGRGWALSFGLIALPYYENTNPQLAGIARYAIDEALADHNES